MLLATDGPAIGYASLPVSRLPRGARLKRELERPRTTRPLDGGTKRAERGAGVPAAGAAGKGPAGRIASTTLAHKGFSALGGGFVLHTARFA